MKKIWVLLVLFALTFFLSAGAVGAAGVENADKPAKGQWDFKVQKVWSIDAAGDDILGEIRSIKVSEDGTVYFHDGRNKRYYIFDKNGTFVKAFGKKGEGPGEIKWIGQARFFPVNDKIIIADMDSIHYFSRGGDYIRSVKNNYMNHRPSLFIDEDEFISAPLLQIETRGKPSTINRYNLKTGEETVITPFSVFTGGVARSGGSVIAMVDQALTPMMIIGFDGKRLYYGMNNSYTIDVSDVSGKKELTFTLDREAKTVSEADKRKRFDRGGSAPEAMVEKIIKSMPDTLTYFSRIESYNGLIYVFPTGLDRGSRQEIDIFSADGKYLYRAAIEVEEGSRIQTDPFIKDNHLYLVVEDEEGEVAINKYKIALPTG